MTNKITHSGVLDINGMKLPVYVLEDGTRIISGREMQRSLNMVDAEDDAVKTSGARLSRYLNQKSLQPFIYKEKEPGHFEPIIAYKGKAKINGYEATILVDICDAFLEARKHISLSTRQEMIATQAEILLRSFAKVGIIALIDEATGYQYDREKDALREIFKAYVSEELLDWQLTFTISFYKEIFRLWNIPFTDKYIKRKPQFIGGITKKFVYDLLPKGVYDLLKAKTPKTVSGNYKARLHQSLTPEIGREHLKRQIIEVTTLMSISANKEEFIRLFARKYGQLEFKYEDLEYTEEQDTVKDDNQFLKTLKAVASVPPPQKNKKPKS